VLAEIGADDIPQIVVYNKIDRLQSPASMERDAEGVIASVWISAQKHAGLDLLESAISERLACVARRARVRIAASGGAVRSRLYASGAVREENVAEDGSMELTVELPDVELLTLARTAGVQILETQGSDVPCTPGDAYLKSSPALSAAKLP
jgi:GTP-binding protein HflX